MSENVEILLREMLQANLHHGSGEQLGVCLIQVAPYTKRRYGGGKGCGEEMD